MVTHSCGDSNCESACIAGDPVSIPVSGRSPGGGNGNPLQYSCLENPRGQRSLADYSLWGRKESDATKRLTFSPSHPRFHSHSSQRSFVAGPAPKRKKSKLSWGPAWRHHRITSPNAISQKPQGPSPPRFQERWLTAPPFPGRSSKEFVARLFQLNVEVRCVQGTEAVWAQDASLGIQETLGKQDGLILILEEVMDVRTICTPWTVPLTHRQWHNMLN